MLIVSENLKQLAASEKVCPAELVEEFCVKIKLGENYFEPRTDLDVTVNYGNHPEPKELFHDQQQIAQNLKLHPSGRVIACSADKYKIPLDHFGLVQTKGTLARLFVHATCGDGQIEPGFEGYITLEIVNLSPWIIEIPKYGEVAQLYMFKASTQVEQGYHGRYAAAAQIGPTIPIFRR